MTRSKSITRLISTQRDTAHNLAVEGAGDTSDSDRDIRPMRPTQVFTGVVAATGGAALLIPTLAGGGGSDARSAVGLSAWLKLGSPPNSSSEPAA